MQQFRDNSPDILLVDLQATTTQGVNTIREIRQLTTGGETPILAIADEDDGQDPAQSLDAGANYFLPNPATPAQLLQKMLALFNGITRGPENAISE
jgi:DNA-binding response OmpR family regulator